MRRVTGVCAVALLFTLAVGAWAQTVYQVDVKRGTVVYVSGNDLVVKMEDNNLRHFVVPADSKFTVDGKEIGLQDLKAGTQLTQTVTLQIAEEVVTQIRTVDAKVLEVKPPHLTIAEGDTEKYITVPEGTTFIINGKQLMLSDLRAGMRVKGTVVTAVPTTVMARTTELTGQTPKPVDAPVLVGVLLIEQVEK